jgi:hypothetical protein
MEFAKKYGAISLLHQIKRETDVRNKEAVFGAVSSYIRGNNLQGKREFL